MAGRVVKISLYYKTDLNEINDRYSLELSDTSEASWILEIQGLTERERDLVYNKYDRLWRPKSEWITGESPLIDIEAGALDKFIDVSPFFDTFESKLSFVPDPANPPPNTTDFQPNEVRTWIFTKL